MKRIKNIFSYLPEILPRGDNSVLKRYVEAHDEEKEEYEDVLDTVKQSHQIDAASSGTKSTGVVQFEVVEDSITTIEKGTVVGTQPNDNGDFLKFETTETIEVSSSSSSTFWGNAWDTINWALPPSQNTISTEAKIVAKGVGSEYNVEANTITYLPETSPGVVSVNNQKPTDGGVTTDLDQIGELFGPLGERGERTDSQYKSYLQSIVPAFNGRGTVPSIKSVVSIGVSVDNSDVSIDEHFQDLEYTIVLSDWEKHAVSTVEELADLSDASVSKLRKTSYREYDVSQSSDEVAVTVESDSTNSDTAKVDDSVTTTKSNVQWNDGDWGSTKWAVEQ